LKLPRDTEIDNMLPKPSFVVKQRSKTQRFSFWFCSKNNEVQNEPGNTAEMELDESADSLPQHSEDDYIWYQSSHVVKGISAVHTAQEDDN